MVHRKSMSSKIAINLWSEMLQKMVSLVFFFSSFILALFPINLWQIVYCFLFDCAGISHFTLFIRNSNENERNETH